MILKSFAVFLPALLAGFGFVHFLWKNDTPLALALKLFAGIGAGPGIVSCLYFVRLLALPGQGGYLLIEVIFLVLVLIGLLAKKRLYFSALSQRLPLTRLHILLGLALVFVITIAFYFLLIYARLIPHGDYDAQAIWNLRARSIFRSANAWENAFSPLINRNFHMDYPLLIPLSVVGGWNTLGSEVLRLPATLSMLFLLAMAGITFSLIAYLRCSTQAAIAVILLLATPNLLLFSTFQTADIPLTYFFLAATSLLVLAGQEGDKGLFFLAGLMAGLSAWTKNEGIPFLMSMILCTLFVFGVRRSWTHLPSLVAGMALPILTIVLFKTLISVNNDLFAENGLSQIVLRLFTPSRYIQILNHLALELLHLGNWPISIIVVLFVYGCIMGVKNLRSSAEKSLWLLPLGQFAVYMLIYVMTPHDLEWHMNYSMSRLLVHLFPMALCAFFLFVNTPELVLNKVK